LTEYKAIVGPSTDRGRLSDGIEIANESPKVSPLFFATDLTNFVACRHLALERLRAHRLARRLFFDDPMLEILRERGLIHERAYVEHLAKSGKCVVEIDKESPTAFDQTLAAIREGADVIVQARLEQGVGRMA
jgi:hypothetical protein